MRLLENVKIEGLEIENILHRHEVGEKVKVSGTWSNVYCNVRSQVHLRLVGPEKIETVDGPIYAQSKHNWKRDWYANVSGPWCVILGLSARGCNDPDPYVSEVHVWGDPEVAPIEKIILEHLLGRGADRKYVAAGENKYDLRRWLTGNLLPGGKPWTILAGGVECPLVLSCFGWKIGHSKFANNFDTSAQARVFGQIPAEERIGFLASCRGLKAQAEYARAVETPELAAKWVLTHANIYKIEEKLFLAGDNGLLREFSGKSFGEAGWLTPMNWRPEVVSAVTGATPKLDEPIFAERIAVYGYAEDMEAQMRAAGLLEEHYYDGAAQAGKTRFVLASKHVRGDLSLGICEADNLETVGVRPSTENPKDYVWSVVSQDGSPTASLQNFGAKLEIWKVR